MKNKAAVALSFFETATRQNGTLFFRVKAGAPDWVGDLVREAHGDQFPNDIRYKIIHTALEGIAEEGEDFDAETDCYTADLVTWLSSHGSRVGYVDAAAEELGVSAEATLFERLTLGQAYEQREVRDLLVGALTRLDDEEAVAS